MIWYLVFIIIFISFKWYLAAIAVAVFAIIMTITEK